MIALTSLSPHAQHAENQAACLKSWRAAGLEVVSMNHPSEQALLRYPGVECIATEDTAEKVYGKPFVKLNCMLNWIGMQSEPVLLVNGDLHLDARAAQLAQLSTLAADGLPFLLQTNINADGGDPKPETWGLSAFVVNPKFCDLFQVSTLCMAEPWWDYWLPYAFICFGLPIYNAGHGLAHHVRHASKAWSGSDWHACGLEFDRMFHMLPAGESSVQGCESMAALVMELIGKNARAVAW